MTTAMDLPFYVELIQCPDCAQWAMGNMFADRMILVEDCCDVEHIAIVCPYCAEITDLILNEVNEQTVEWSDTCF